MKKIFVSHPFTGNEKQNRSDAAGIVANLRYEHPDMQFINPLEVFRPLGGWCPEYAILAACMNLIRQCDAVLQCDGWEKSAGCRAEAAFAIVNEIPCIDRDGLDEIGGDADD